MQKNNSNSFIYKIIYSLISFYDIPADDSLTATDWLNELKETEENNVNINAEQLLLYLADKKILKKENKGYTPYDEYYRQGLFDVAEYTTFGPKYKVKSYTLLFTEKGKEELLPLVKELIASKQNDFIP